MNLQRFSIYKLHGYKDCHLEFKDSVLILVGENGSGKTTVLKMLYYTLSCQWQALYKYKFNSIMLELNGELLEINKAELEIYLATDSKDFLGIAAKKIMQKMKGAKLVIEADGPPSITIERIGKTDLQENIKLPDVKAALRQIKILYLPTYRRIEEKLSSIFNEIDEAQYRRKISDDYIELTQFGMKDVDNAIDLTLKQLKEFARENLNSLTLGYLSDVVDKRYSEVDVSQIKNTSDETINNILKRIDNKILSEESKRHLSATIANVKNNEKLTDEHEKVICHYFIKMLNFQQELEAKELGIKNFCEVCNKYLEDKVFKYTTTSLSFSILLTQVANNAREISLEQLSSGEKKIVSLFSHVYLSGDTKYFVMIDEPELSLSVPWQRQFLVDIKSLYDIFSASRL